MKTSARDRIVSYIFFGNYFYGACAVALCIEAGLQQYFPLNSFLFYLLVFFSTVLYYTMAYISEGGTDIANRRSVWYRANRTLIKRSRLVISIAFGLVFLLYLPIVLSGLQEASVLSWLLLLLFPLAAALYYGSSGRYNLRTIGWLKPFVIGFAWAGVVTIFPVLFYTLEHSIPFEPGLISFILFVKNFMFISLLCILFDIKDYATDYNEQLKTFVVKIGVRKTIFYIIIPLSVLGWGAFLAYGLSHQFSSEKILLNTVPFLGLLLIAYSLHRRRSILYYLIVIDGLMLLKAVSGITAMLFY